MSRITFIAFAGALVVSTASIVGASPAIAADTTHAIVSYSDLDLGSAHGRTQLDRRIAVAADTVCAATNGRELDQIAACRRTSISDARGAVERAEKTGVTTLALN